MALLLQQTIRFAQVTRAEPVIIVHENIQSTRRGQKDGGAGDDTREAHLDTLSQNSTRRAVINARTREYRQERWAGTIAVLYCFIDTTSNTSCSLPRLESPRLAGRSAFESPGTSQSRGGTFDGANQFNGFGTGRKSGESPPVRTCPDEASGRVFPR